MKIKLAALAAGTLMAAAAHGDDGLPWWLKGLYTVTSRGPHNIRPICEIKNEDGGKLQAVYYDAGGPEIIRDVGGKVKDGIGVRYVRPNGREKMLFLGGRSAGGVTSWLLEDYPQAVCSRSFAQGKVIVVWPIIDSHYGLYEVENFDRNDTRKQPSETTSNVFLISSDGGKTFNWREARQGGGPYGVGADGEVIFADAWNISRRAAWDGANLIIEQTKTTDWWRGKMPYKEFEERYRATSRDRYQRGDTWWRYQWGAGKNCPECEPTFWRKIVSKDYGQTWEVAEWKVLRPEILPPGTTVRMEKPPEAAKWGGGSRARLSSICSRKSSGSGKHRRATSRYGRSSRWTCRSLTMMCVTDHEISARDGHSGACFSVAGLALPDGQWRDSLARLWRRGNVRGQ